MLLKALAFGVLAETAAVAASVGCIAIGGWGPCGPASYWSMAGALLQFPGWHLELEVLRWGIHPGVPGFSWELPIIFLMQVLFWSTARLLWRVRPVRAVQVEGQATTPDSGRPGTAGGLGAPDDPPPVS